MANLLLQLPDHIVNLIIGGLEFEDLIRFSCVNRGFKSLASSLLPPQLNPCLIIPYGDFKSPLGSICDTTLGMFNHSNGKIYKVNAPEMEGHRIIGSCQGGWLITVHNYTEIQVFHPLCKSILDLPPMTTSTCGGGSRHIDEDYLRYILGQEPYICKATMSSDNPRTSLVIAIVGFGRFLIHCRPGIDTNWISVKHTVYNDVIYEDVRFCKGKFYAVGNTGDVYVIDDLDSLPRIFRGCPFLSSPSTVVDTHYLVESLGELFVIRRTQEGCGAEIESYKTTDVQVSKLNLDEPGSWVDVDDLGVNRAFFVGCYSAFSLSTSDYPSCKENSIYFTDDHVNIGFRFSGCDVVVFNLKSGVIEKCYSRDPGFRKPPPVWFTTASG